MPLGHGSFEHGNVFLTFDTSFRLGEDEDGDVETRIITLESKGVTTFRDSLHFHSSERSFHCLHHTAGAQAFTQSPTLHLSVNIPIFAWRSVQNRAYRSRYTRSWRVHSTKRQSECSLNCHVFNFMVFRDLCAVVSKSLIEPRTTTVPTGPRIEHRFRNAEPPERHFPAWRW